MEIPPSTAYLIVPGYCTTEIPPMKVTRVATLSFGGEARDVVFWTDDLLLLTTPSAEVWRAIAEPGQHPGELLFAANEVLAPVAQALGQLHVQPASGGYPRLAASVHAGVVVVNTHDLVLVACPLHGSRSPSLLFFGWGQYYPSLAFSRDGSRFSVTADHLLVFDTDSWQGQTRNACEVCAWHPREPMLLGLHRYTGQLGWTDWRDSANPALRPLGVLTAAQERIEPAGLIVDAAGDRCVIAFAHPHRLEWWQLHPLQRIDSRLVEEGEIVELQPSPEAGVFAVETTAGVRVWDLERREPLSDLIGGATGLRFSPSGRRFVTRSRAATNPYPLQSSEGEPSVTLWRVSM
jgi:hypothetical protein